MRQNSILHNRTRQHNTEATKTTTTKPTMTKKQLKQYIKGLVDYLAKMGCTEFQKAAIIEEIMLAKFYLEAAETITNY